MTFIYTQIYCLVSHCKFASESSICIVYNKYRKKCRFSSNSGSQLKAGYNDDNGRGRGQHEQIQAGSKKKKGPRKKQGG